MRFLGTGAADMIPSPFCNCPVCCAGRKDRRFNRLRSLFLLDGKTLIDFGPDLGAAAMKYGLDLSGVETVFVTHTHEDHFALSNFDLLRMGKKEHMDVYLSTPAYATLMEAKECFGDRFYRDDFRAIEEGRVSLHPVEVGKQYSLGGYDVLAVNTTHKASFRETAINYRFTKDGHSLLYACDTGIYLQESLELLQGSELDVLIMEGTWGGRQDKPADSHLNGYAFVKQLETFRDYGIIRKDTDIYCTHINHRHDWSHEQYQRWMDENTEYHVTVAYDGLEVEWRKEIHE